MLKRIIRLALVCSLVFVAVHSTLARPLVFIHGMGGSEGTWTRFRALAAGRICNDDEILPVDYSRMTGTTGAGNSIDEIANIVANRVRLFLNSRPEGMCESADFVVHSMGGLVLREMVARGYISDAMIHRVVMLATPNYGQDQYGRSQQSAQMSYGSTYMWELANEANQISPLKVLCQIGTADALVRQFSAILEDADARYVIGKDHTSFMEETIGKLPGVAVNGICYCDGGVDDPVFQLTESFLRSGSAASTSAGVRTFSTLDEGGILLQVVDKDKKPVAYASQVVSGVQDASTDANVKFRNFSYARTGYADVGNSLQQGVSMVLESASSNGTGLRSGRYKFSFPDSADTRVQAFTYDESIEIKRGRTVVKTIPAKAKEIDFVFLIDSTGSMDDDIDSVKSAAVQLVGKLMGGGDDVRVAVADYRDHPGWTGGGSDYPFKLITPFTGGFIHGHQCDQQYHD